MIQSETDEVGKKTKFCWYEKTISPRLKQRFANTFLYKDTLFN